MTTNLILMLGLTVLLLSCAQQTDQQEASSVKPKNAIAETVYIDTIAKEQRDETISPYQQELNNALADPLIDEYYKVIYRQEKLVLADDSKMLSITEKLFSSDPDKDLFYFIVFTKSMNGSDGFYSEAIGHSAFRFVTTKTEQFADYFNLAPKLTDRDMESWAQYVCGEIQISREQQVEIAVGELEAQILTNIQEARKEYRVVIGRFIEKLKSKMP